MNQIRKFRRPLEHLNEPLSSSNQSDEVEHKVSGKLESSFSDPIVDRSTNGICELKQLKNQNPHRIIIGHLNLNSVRNKFESLVTFAGNNIDILMVSDTKLDDTFLEKKFLIDNFSKPFRLDQRWRNFVLYKREYTLYIHKTNHFKKFLRGVFW